MQPLPNDRSRTLPRVFLLFIGALACLPAGATGPRDAEKYFFQETFGDLDEELVLAGRNTKRHLGVF